MCSARVPDMQIRDLDSIRREESGATLIIAAMVLVILMGMAGFAVDYGWLYWNGIKIQHGADAAALAGVIYEPGNQTLAYSEARGAASENGYIHLSGSTVTPVDFLDDSSAVDNANQLAVTVSHSVPTFFMKVFGINDVSITKRAVAEYALPLAMGSDLPYFGQDPTDPSRNPNFWANIHGYYTGRKMGDRFASQCDSGGSGSGCTANDEARPTVSRGINNGMADLSGGYIYGIDTTGASGSLSVDIFDGTFFRGGGDLILAGDNPQGGSQGPTTVFLLYAPDPTPLDTSDNKLLCKVTYAPQDSFADFNGDGSVNASDDVDGDGDLDWDDVSHANGLGPTGFAALWDNLCTINTGTEGQGIYPLRVVIEDPGGNDDRGLNRYSMRASTSVGSPRFFGLGDMAAYVNFASNKATFNLAEVPEVHAGKELVIELWDPDSGNSAVRIERPDGTLPECSWNATDGSGSGGALIPCNITGYGPQQFNDHHMQIRIAIPNTYSCTTDCWWTIEVTYNGGANDTTTWSARIEGNPVKLVE